MKENLNPKEVIQLVAIGSLSKLEAAKFYVANYQRGYRWQKEQVLLLLNDINLLLLNDINDKIPRKTYCLQPLVVLWQEAQGYWELIDGQQRLTTIYLILNILKANYSITDMSTTYSLQYATRANTAVFLEKLVNPNNIGKSFDDLSEAGENNIDNHCLYNSYKTIKEWLENKSLEAVSSFYKRLTEETAVIWYPFQLQEGSTQDAKQIFLNLNSGKIKLNSAELIKALFILQIQESEESWDIKQFKKDKLAQEWDQMERGLHRDSLWFFIQKKQSNNKHTRIGLLFDLIQKRPPDERDALFAYKQYEGKFKNNSTTFLESWNAVKQQYAKIEDWYEDIALFHRIGFLIHSESEWNFPALVVLLNNKKKQKVKEILEEKIKIVLNKKNKTIEELNYVDDRQLCQDVLFWYNILTIEQQPQQRFPFEAYHGHERWSLEHIHPQNPVELKEEDLKKWLVEQEYLLGSKEDNMTLITQIKKISEELEKEKKERDQKQLKENVKQLKEAMTTSFSLHHLGNLALLDQGTNAALSNLPFLAKRKKILGKAQNGLYIPAATLHTFLKKHSQEGDTFQMKYWSEEDAERYKQSIINLLGNYLKTEINEQ